jgi:plasmid stabilization system protein ParE
VGAPRLEIAVGAVEEGLEAVRWYESRSVKAARSFRLEIRLAFDRIRDSPLSWPHYHWGTRRLLLRRFPYQVVYRIKPDHVLVVAIAHTKQRPGYWRERGP